MHLVLGAVLDLKNEPREAPGTLKNDAPVEAGAQILIFRGFRPRAQKRAKKEPPGRPKWSPNRPPEPLGRVKSRWEILPEPPRKFTMNFFSAPEASGSDLGAPREGKKRISCCAPCCFRLREAPGSDFGAILARCLSVFWGVFEAILK